MKKEMETFFKRQFSKVQQSVFFEKYQMALEHYLSALRSLEGIYSGEAEDVETGTMVESVESTQ